MAYISKTGISNTSTIDADHITRIIDALDGTAATEVSASGQFDGSHSGSFTGSFTGDGTNITGVTAEWDGTHNGNAQITGSLVVTANLTASGAISASNFTGTTSGTNTGDQDLSSYAQTANVVANSATASFIVNAQTSSMSVATASFLIGSSGTASYVEGGNVDGAVGTATNATNATNVAITGTTTDATFYVHFGSATSGNDGVNISNGISFNPNSKTITTQTASLGIISASGAQDWSGGLNQPHVVSLNNSAVADLSGSLVAGALHVIDASTNSNSIDITLPSTDIGTYRFLMSPTANVGSNVAVRFKATTFNGFTSQQQFASEGEPAPYNSNHTGSGNYIRNNSHTSALYKADYWEFTPYAAGRYFFSGKVNQLNLWDIG
jgi:hypothetical protein